MAFNETNETGTTSFNSTEEHFIWDNFGLEILSAIVSLIAVVSDVIISWSILRSGSMRTRVNIYIVNWCLSNIVGMISYPILAIMNIFGVVDTMGFKVLCIWEEIMFNQMFANLAFAAVLIFDWYVVTYCGQNCGLRCRKSARFIVGGIWMFSFSFFVASATLCFKRFTFATPLSVLNYFLGYLVVFVFIIFIHVLRLIKKKTSSIIVEKNNLELILVTSFFLCWLPNCITLYSYVFFRRRWTHWSRIVDHLTYILGFCNPPILLYLMYRFDEKFNESCRKVLGRSHAKDDVEDCNNKEAGDTMLL